MKKFLIYSLLAAVLFGNSGAGCGSKDSDDPQPSAGVFIRMKVNGKDWAATSQISGLAGKVNGLASNGLITFSGDAGKENITVNIYGTDKPGTYTITNQSGNGSIAAYANTSDGINGAYLSTKAPGSNLIVNVTQASSERVTGQFSGTLNLEYALGTGTTGPTSVVITNGEFSVTP